MLEGCANPRRMKGEAKKRTGNEVDANKVFMIASTSKITFAEIGFKLTKYYGFSL